MTSQSPTPKLHAAPRLSLGPWRLWEESPWATCLAVLGYLGVAALCFRSSRREGLFWLGIAEFYLILGLDRYLGVLSRLSALLRRSLRARGWYWSLRRPTQTVLMFVAAGVIAAIFYKLLGLAASPAATVALAAAAYSGALILLRAISFHEFDMLLYRKRKILRGRRINLLVEFLGLAIAAAAAMVH
jgi:hypothetical protein